MQIQTLIHLAIVALYLVVGAFAWRYVYPRLPRSSQALATVFFVLFAALTIWSELNYKAAESVRRVWGIAWEWGIPTRVAALQMALVGSISLANALLVYRRARLASLYFLTLAAMFSFLSYKEYIDYALAGGWQQRYALAGAVLLLLMVAFTPGMARRDRQWIPLKGLLLCIPAGLVIGAVGALGLDLIEHQLIDWARDNLDQRLWPPLLEETLEFLGIWLALAAMLGLFAALNPSRWLRWLVVAAAAAGLLASFALPVYFEEPAGNITKTRVHFDGDIQLRGYTLQLVEKGRKLHVHIHLSPGAAGFEGLGFSIVLIDQASRAALSKDDKRADADLDAWETTDGRTVYRQWTDLDIPRQQASNRALWVALALWREDDGQFLPLQVLSSELPTPGDGQVILDEFVLRAQAAPPASDYLARFDNGFTLEQARLPARVQLGEPLYATFAWRADEDGVEDLTQLLHLQHLDSGQWFAFDAPPLGARLPTRLWYAGLADSETWHAPLPADMPPGRYRAFSGLYRASDKARLPARDAAGAAFIDHLIPLGDSSEVAVGASG